jgi:hypothetical protein
VDQTAFLPRELSLPKYLHNNAVTQHDDAAKAHQSSKQAPSKSGEKIGKK